MHHTREKRTATGSEEKVAIKTSVLKSQRLQSEEGTQKNQYSSELNGSTHISALSKRRKKHSKEGSYGDTHYFSADKQVSLKRRHESQKYPKEFSTARRKTQAIPKLSQFVCRKCGRIFSRKDNLKRHITNIHRNPRACTICGKRFRSNPSLKKHQDFAHSTKPKTFYDTSE